MDTVALPPARRPKYPSDRELSFGIKWSIIFHLALMTAVIVKSLVFPSESIMMHIPTLRVDIVDLPDVLKKDLKNITQAPVSDEIQKALDQPVKEEVKANPSKKEVEPAAPDEMVLKREIEKKEKSEKETEAEREKRMKSALSRIKSLEKLGAEDKALPIKGNKISRGTSLSGDAREAAVASYFDLIRDRLQENWALPIWLQRQKYAAQVQIWIDTRGKLRNFKFLKASGNTQFDDEVKKTLQKSQPFPVPPEDISSSLLVDGVAIGFPL